jgi:hypothetical protein
MNEWLDEFVNVEWNLILVFVRPYNFNASEISQTPRSLLTAVYKTPKTPNQFVFVLKMVIAMLVEMFDIFQYLTQLRSVSRSFTLNSSRENVSITTI